MNYCQLLTTTSAVGLIYHGLCGFVCLHLSGKSAARAQLCYTECCFTLPAGLQTLAALCESWQHQRGGEGQRQPAVRFGQHRQLRPPEQSEQATPEEPLQCSHHGWLRSIFEWLLSSLSHNGGIICLGESFFLLKAKAHFVFLRRMSLTFWRIWRLLAAKRPCPCWRCFFFLLSFNAIFEWMFFVT